MSNQIERTLDTREAYEAACSEMGCIPLTDEEILKRAYGIKHNEESDNALVATNRSTGHLKLARDRLNHLENKEKEEKK